MIRFFREKAAVFIWVIVIAFGATLLAGSVFMGLGLGAQKQQTQDEQRVYKDFATFFFTKISFYFTHLFIY